MNTDVLFDRAFAIRAAKPWQHLFDTHIFAVCFSDGEIACCSVMGRNGTHLALALYSLTDGLYALDKLMTTDMRVLPRHRAEECMLGQDCIQVSFENAQEILAKEAKPVRAYAKAHGISLRGQHNFPVFHRYRPARMPWALTDETEQQHLLEAMDALLEISRRLNTEEPLALGLIEGDPFTHPIPLLTATPDGYRWDSYTLQKPDAPTLPAGKIEDELALARLKKRKKPCAPWALAVFMSPTPVQAKPAQVPYFPYLLCVVDTGSGKVLTLTPPRKIDEYAPHFSADFLPLLQQHGLPREFWSADDRTTAFITPIAKQLGIPVNVQADMTPMDELLDELYDHLNDASFEGADEMGNAPDDAEVLRLLAAHIADAPETLRAIPDYMLTEIRAAIAALPNSRDALRALDKEIKRRRLPPQQ